MLRRTSLMKAVDVKDFAHARLVTLNREKALNAVDNTMIAEMAKHYMHTPHPEADAVYILKGAGTKAFCAGGDVVTLVKDTRAQREFFYNEYQVNHHILTMKRTQVALWNGIVMGGGVGLSVHGKFRVATEKALFAMPETSIGLFPDVGGSWFLPRLPNKSFGLYLALAGQRLKGAELKTAGLATHYVSSELLPSLEESLCQVKSSADAVALLDEYDGKTAKSAAASAGIISEDLLKVVEHAYKSSFAVEDIVEALRSHGTALATKQAGVLQECCPSALKVSLELFRRGGMIQTPADIFRMEYVATQRAMVHGDFCRGVTAKLIDKTGNPVWNPSTLEGVSKELVESFFTPVSADTKQWHPTTPFDAAIPFGAAK